MMIYFYLDIPGGISNTEYWVIHRAVTADRQLHERAQAVGGQALAEFRAATAGFKDAR